jgi:2-(1,2-epoxy-1,2-dihydrophenyl)acetyl-CoA isomerase
MTTTSPAAPVRLELDHERRVAHIVLASEDTGNAFELDFIRALRDAVRHVADVTRDTAPGSMAAVLLRAEGRNFSVGGDLREFVAQGDNVGPYVRELADTAHAAVLALAGLQVPVVAEVRGAVAGGGVGLALTADLIVAARSTKLRLAYTAIGLTPDCGTSWFLPRMLGEQRALDLTLTNRTLTPAEAEQWGLFSRVVDDAEAPLVAGELADSLAAGHGSALRRAKLLMRDRRLAGLRERLELEAALIAEAAARPGVRVGV